MNQQQIERQLRERERPALSRGLDRGSLVLGLVAIAAALFLWITRDNWAAGLLAFVGAFLLVGALVRWWLGRHTAMGPEPAVDGSLLQAFRYRWYHAPQMVAQMFMAALVGLAGLGYTVSLSGNLAGLLAGTLWAALFGAVAYTAWRTASPKVRDADRTRAAKDMARRQGN